MIHSAACEFWQPNSRGGQHPYHSEWLFYRHLKIFPRLDLKREIPRNLTKRPSYDLILRLVIFVDRPIASISLSGMTMFTMLKYYKYATPLLPLPSSRTFSFPTIIIKEGILIMIIMNSWRRDCKAAINIIKILSRKRFSFSLILLAYNGFVVQVNRATDL